MKPEQMKPTPASFSKEIPCEKGYELRRGCEGVIAVFTDRKRSSEFIFWNTSTKELPELVLDGELNDARRERKAGRGRVIGSRSKRRTAARSTKSERSGTSDRTLSYWQYLGSQRRIEVG